MWDVGTVADGASATLTITATVVSPDAQTNTATISDADQFDPNTGNNSASATETPQQADLAVTKSVSNPTPNVGDTITFTITVANAGPDTATGVTVTDLLPAGVTFVSASASQGTYNNVTGIWTVGTVAPSATADPDHHRHGERARPDREHGDHRRRPVRPQHRATTPPAPRPTPSPPTWRSSSRVSDPTPNIGDTSPTPSPSTNTGPDTATGVTVTDLLPDGVTFVSSTASQGTYDNVTGIWTVGTVAPAATATLTIVVTVDKTNADREHGDRRRRPVRPHPGQQHRQLPGQGHRKPTCCSSRPSATRPPTSATRSRSPSPCSTAARTRRRGCR